jgi:hypothetical protein
MHDFTGRLPVRLQLSDGVVVRISDVARKFTVFFGSPDPQKDGKTIYGGTGFLVLYREEGAAFPYLVTCRHVAKQMEPGSEIFVRVNSKDGRTSVPMGLDEAVWAFHPDPTVDVAVTLAYLDPKDWDVGYYELADRVKPSSSPHRVQYGDDICIVGLFHWHSGQERNMPIVHSGTIALLPDPNEKVLIKDRTTGKAERVDVYLVEAQTFEGLSGAPVFQREAVALREFSEHNGGRPIVLTGAQLLGVYAGAWDGPPSEALAADRKWGPDKRIPAGMGLVVPAERIAETIVDDDGLKKHRADVIKKQQESSAVVTDAAFPVPSASDANPTHREDFTRLLDEAARKGRGRNASS